MKVAWFLSQNIDRTNPYVLICSSKRSEKRRKITSSVIKSKWSNIVHLEKSSLEVQITLKDYIMYVIKRNHRIWWEKQNKTNPTLFFYLSACSNNTHKTRKMETSTKVNKILYYHKFVQPYLGEDRLGYLCFWWKTKPIKINQPYTPSTPYFQNKEPK